jgi:phage terminase small subunit
LLRGESRPSRTATSPKDQEPPSKPADLDAGAAAEWDRILGVTTHIGAAHASIFRAYCEATAAANAMKPKGSREWSNLVNLHRQLARELCLTPATGAHLVGTVKQKEDKLAKFLA